MTSDEDEKAKHVLKALDVKRKALEMEMAATLDELTAPSADGGAPMGVDTPLTDTDGYPRADIDIYRARNLRHRLAVIKTDHQALLQQVEAGLTNVSSFHVSHRSSLVAFCSLSCWIGSDIFEVAFFRFYGIVIQILFEVISHSRLFNQFFGLSTSCFRGIVVVRMIQMRRNDRLAWHPNRNQNLMLPLANG